MLAMPSTLQSAPGLLALAEHLPMDPMPASPATCHRGQTSAGSPVRYASDNRSSSPLPSPLPTSKSRSSVGFWNRVTRQIGTPCERIGTGAPKVIPFREPSPALPVPTHEVSVIPSHSERQYRSVVPLRIWMSCSEPDHPRSRSLPLPVSPVAGGTVRSSCCSCDGLTRPHPDAQRSREALHGTHCTTRRFTKPRAFITTFTRRDGRSFRSGFIWFFGIRTSGSSNCPATPHVGAALGSGGSKPSRRAPRILSGDLSDPGAGHDGVARPTHASSLITQTPFCLASASQLSSPSAQISVGVPREEVVAASKVSHTAAQLPPRPATRSP